MSAADRREAALARVEALAPELAAAVREALVADDEMYQGRIRGLEAGGTARGRITAALRCLDTAQEPTW